MKRFITIIIGLVLICTLVGCGKNTNNTTADIIIAKPGELCFDDTYLVAGPFETFEKALYHENIY